MRDNLHEDLFADHAWLEMRKVLDREMPERKRRGFFWLWLLPALGLCTLLSRDTLPLALSNPDTKQPKPEQPIAQKHEPRLQPTHPIQPQAKDRPLDNAAMTSEPLPSTLERTQENQQALSPAAGTASIHSFSNAGATPLEKSNPLAEHPTKQTTHKPTENMGSSTENIDASNNNEVVLEKIEVAAQIEQPRSLPLLSKVRAVEAPSQYLPLPRQKLRHEWWLEAGTQLNLGISGLSGYRVGLGQALPLGNKNRLWLGLAYESTETSFLQRISADSMGQNGITGGAPTGIPTGTKVGISLPNADQPAISSPGRQNGGKTISSIHLQLVHFQASFFHPFHRRWGMALGGGVQYLQGIKLADRYVRSPFASQAEASFDINFSSNGSNQAPISNLSKDNFRTFGFSTHAALQYQLGPRWSTQLGVRHTLQHFTKEEQLLLRPTWVDWGLRYRIR
jgi:hypothetical protein